MLVVYWGVLMNRYAAWLGSTVLALAALIVSIPPIIDSWPRWALLAFGLVVGVGVVLTFPHRHPPGDRGQTPAGKQSQRAGKNSRNVQAGRDVNLSGGMGDRET